MKMSSASKSNIMAIDESGASLVDFDLSESKFTIGNMFDKTNDNRIEQLTQIKRQGTDSSLPGNGATKPLHEMKPSNGTLNRSGRLNRSNGGPEDELAMSMDDTNFELSESNFSHSMMSNKIGAFASG